MILEYIVKLANIIRTTVPVENRNKFTHEKNEKRAEVKKERKKERRKTHQVGEASTIPTQASEHLLHPTPNLQFVKCHITSVKR